MRLPSKKLLINYLIVLSWFYGLYQITIWSITTTDSALESGAVDRSWLVRKLMESTDLSLGTLQFFFQIIVLFVLPQLWVLANSKRFNRFKNATTYLNKNDIRVNPFLVFLIILFVAFLAVYIVSWFI